MKEFFSGFFWGIVLLYFGVILLGHALHRDDTDPPGDRSGLRLYKDNLTGCEYVGAMFQGLSPRLDKDGRQVCRP